jgi:nitrite reductase/ring-hydroxylating ferredoxin subunit
MFNPEVVANRRPIDRLSRSTRIGALAARIQPFVAKVLADAGLPVQNILHGSALGHPLHAVITDVPIGAWTVTAVLDTIELLGTRAAAEPDAEAVPPSKGGDAALVIGLAGAAGASITGWADWSDTSDDPRTLGMAHALVNVTATAGYVLALVLRRTGHRRLGLLTALAAYGIVSAGAYLGGELSFGQLLGAKHTAEPIVPPAEFTPVLSASDLSPGTPVRADFNGIPVLLSRSGDRIAAISAICTHRGAPLNAGTFADGCVRCPWHGSVFALADGRIVAGPATFPQPRFEARINAGQIELRAFDGSAPD